MLSLILFRHGKSDWDAPFASDRERPLAARGKEAARCMGRLLHQTQQVPELAISSSAIRAKDTLQLAARAGRWGCPLRVAPELYETTSQAALTWIQRLDQNPASLLLTGHEPCWSDLAGRLIGSAMIRIPTAAMLRIDFEAGRWQHIEPGHGELRWLLPPRIVCRSRAAR